MNAFFSPSRNTFFNSDWRDLYDAAGTWPADAIEVGTETFQEFAMGDPPMGKQRAAGEDGLPIWIDVPSPTEEERLVRAVLEISRLLQLAALNIAPLQDAVDTDVATEAEIQSLKAWKLYRVSVNRVPSQNGYPQVIHWPEIPGQLT